MALGLPVTSELDVGAGLVEGQSYQKGTVIMFASELNSGGLGYASSNPAYPNYAPGKSSHFAIIQKDFTYDGKSVPVFHQYEGFGSFKKDNLSTHLDRSQNRAINNLENIRLVKLRSNN